MNDEAFNILKGKMAPKSTVKTKEMSTEPTNKETKNDIPANRECTFSTFTSSLTHFSFLAKVE